MNAKPWSLPWVAILLVTIGGVIAGIGPAVEVLPDAWKATARSVIVVVGLLIPLVLRSPFFDRNHNGIPDVLEPPDGA